MVTKKLIFRMFTVFIATALLIGAVAFPTNVSADSIITVNSIADNIIADGFCTLREAITNANNNAATYADCVAGSGNDTIIFSGSVATVHTITLGSALPNITDVNSLTIDGAGHNTVSGNNGVAVFFVSSGASLTLKNITVANGLSSFGGGLQNNGTTNIIHSTFQNNAAVNDGGGVNNFGTVIIANSTFSGNSANYGGGLSNNGGTATVINSTFSGNSAAISGGGVSTWQGSVTPPSTTIRNTILANSIAGGDCWNGVGAGTLIGSNNIIETTSNCNSIATLTSDPKLGGLTTPSLFLPSNLNEFSTAYFPLSANSPAIDAADDTVCTAPPVNNTSQNPMGLTTVIPVAGTRPQGAHCDIGSFEFEATFHDVPMNYWAWQYIERLYSAGITTGCQLTTLNMNYCPDSIVTRAQMAVFLLKGMHGSSFAPPDVGTSTGFGDVATSYWAAAWIKQLAAEGITGGCGAGNYCPDATVTRAQMAVFLLKAKHGSSYSLPDATGVFTDVPVGYWADKWIEQLAAEGITSGCGVGIYCPDADVTRAQMAVFLVKAFNLP